MPVPRFSLQRGRLWGQENQPWFKDVLAIGLNHETAPVELREKLAIAESELAAELLDLKAATGAREGVILSTCNRTEIIVPGDTSETHLLDWLARRADVPQDILRQHIYTYDNLDAARHLMRVAAGLDSLIVGEPQIFGQLKSAVATARSSGAAGNDLHRFFQRVFGAAKRVRSESKVGEEPVSVAFAAVKLAERVFDSLDSCSAVLLGAGETCALVGRHLRQRGVGKITVVNRGLQKAQALASELDGAAEPLNHLGQALENADLLICSTAAPLPLVGKGMVERALKKRRRRPILIVDVAVPRDVEAEVDELPDAYLYTVDDLAEVIERNKALRMDASERAESIISSELESLKQEQAIEAAGVHVASLRKRGRAIAEQSLSRALRRMKKGEAPELVMARLAHEITNKLLHEPSIGIRQSAADPEALDTALKVLGIHKDEQD